MEDGTLQEVFDTLSKDSDIYQNLAGYMDLTAESTKSCIRSLFDQLVRVFKSSPALTEMLSSTSFDMDNIGKSKTAIFLVVPDENTTFHFLATLFIQLFQIYYLCSLLQEAEILDFIWWFNHMDS